MLRMPYRLKSKCDALAAVLDICKISVVIALDGLYKDLLELGKCN